MVQSRWEKDNEAILPCSENPLGYENFSEKKLKSQGFLKQYFMYPTDMEYFPLVVATTNNEQDFARIAYFFKVMCVKFNTCTRTLQYTKFSFWWQG